MKRKNTNFTSPQMKKQEETRALLLWAAASGREELVQRFGILERGFNETEAEGQRQLYGRNEIRHKEKNSIFQKLFEAFVSPFTVVLFILAFVSFVTDVLMAAPGQKDPAAVIIIGTIVTLSGVLRFTQEQRSGRAAEKLSEMVETTIAVQREGSRIELPIDEIVTGDLIYLAAGDMIPADLRVVQAKDLFIGQSSLTGESDPVEKFGAAITEEAKNPLDCENLVFMGSNVVSGSAAAIAVNVGNDTLFGAMAKDIMGKKPLTSFEKGVNDVSWLLIRFMAVMVPIVLFLNGFTKGDWIQAILFSLSVAVGLTPEMLPMLVSANLARGAVSMSKKNVIVKELNSIQNFGAMDVLCTDKTGTLTQDEVTLMYSLDVQGKKDERILRHAFLNSSHQTGLKNLMDIAIIRFVKEHNIEEEWNGYQKVDEIPFDFSRRRMSVVVEDQNGKTQLITKGAVEEMLSVCTMAEYGGKIEPITDLLRETILNTVSQYNGNGLRVLAIAQKSNPSPAGAFCVQDEKNMVLMGYLAFLDPPKESSAEAVRALQEYGVRVKILTGDNDAVTRFVCGQVGINADGLLLGSDIENMSDKELGRAVEQTDVFAKLSPQQKSRVVSVLRSDGHVVGFMGDGINDAAAMHAADVGISVDTAVDIAKETANIILMEKDLMVLEHGVIEGRKTYANIIKYIKMTASSNFGNMFSVLAASAFLPFLPMLPIQILTLNLIYDFSCLTIPWDNVDADYLKLPRKWDASSIGRFMKWIGPTSSVFDIMTYLVMYFFICPLVFGGAFKTLGTEQQALFIMLFQTGWFVESLWSQTLVIHMIRTPKLPFIQSRASWQLSSLTACGILFGTVLPFTLVGTALDMRRLPLIYFPCLAGIIICYMVLVTVVKKIFISRAGELL